MDNRLVFWWEEITLGMQVSIPESYTTDDTSVAFVPRQTGLWSNEQSPENMCLLLFNIRTTLGPLWARWAIVLDIGTESRYPHRNCLKRAQSPAWAGRKWGFNCLNGIRFSAQWIADGATGFNKATPGSAINAATSQRLTNRWL